MEDLSSSGLIFKRAIASGRRHGINLIQGRSNLAMGDCAIESVIYNINDRPSFPHKYNQTVDYYRRIWMTDMQNKALDDHTWNLGYTNKELWEGFEEMKKPGVYERGVFGDLLLPAIAVGVHKNILVFNTNVQTPHDPISVISPLNFGGYVDSQDPVIIA